MTQETQEERDARVSQTGQIIARHYLARRKQKAVGSGAIRDTLAVAAFVLLTYMTAVILLVL